MGAQYCFTFLRINRFYFSFLICQMVLSLALLIYVLFSEENCHRFKNFSLLNPVVITFEIILTFLIAFDLMMRLFLLKSRFFNSVWNIVDLSVLSTIIVLFIVFYSIQIHDNKLNDSTLQNEDMVGICLLIVRYVLQLFRIIMVVKESRKLRKTNYLVFDFSHSIQTSKYSENENDSSEEEEKPSEIFLDSKKEGLIN